MARYRVRVSSALTVVVLSFASACTRAPAGLVDDFGICRQPPGEFGSTGCADVTGTVVGTRGQPLANVSVGPRSSGGAFNTPYVATDEQGLFRLRLTRYAPAGLIDTVSLWIGATVVPTLPQMVATVRDSVLVQAIVAPVGRVPVAARADISLPVN